MQIEGKCHCGAISYVLHWPGDASQIPARACVCTFCTRHGAVWTTHRDAQLVAVVRESCVSRYSFGTETAAFYVCTRCGAVPFVTSAIDDHTYGAVNVNTFETVNPAGLARTPASFDGEQTGDRLERRKRNWIPVVRISASNT